MYLLLILLISPAFGGPRRSDIDNQLNSIVEFTQETGKLLNDSSVMEDVVEMLQVAEKNMIQMTAELKTLKTEEIRTFFLFVGSDVDVKTLEELKTMDNVFPKFNLAKSYVKETREELRKLAYRTVIEVSDVKPLIEALDETNGALFFKISINRMKDLMNKTLVTLEEAKIKYNMAIEDFENIKAKFQIKNGKLQQFSQKTQESARNASSELKSKRAWNPFLSLFTEVDDVFEKLEFNLEKLQRISDNMLQSVNNFEETIKRASDILEKDIDLAGEWNQNAKTVSENINRYPEKYLRTLQSIRSIFITGLDELKNSAEIFLAHSEHIDQVN